VYWRYAPDISLRVPRVFRLRQGFGGRSDPQDQPKLQRRLAACQSYRAARCLPVFVVQKRPETECDNFHKVELSLSKNSIHRILCAVVPVPAIAEA
jgi:hypothetical protein